MLLHVYQLNAGLYAMLSPLSFPVALNVERTAARETLQLSVR